MFVMRDGRNMEFQKLINIPLACTLIYCQAVRSRTLQGYRAAFHEPTLAEIDAKQEGKGN